MQRSKHKRHFLHLACMLMLLLVHLDTYGYDLICSLQDQPEATWMDADSEASFSTHEDLIEWSDPDYRTYSSRTQFICYTNIYPLPVLREFLGHSILYDSTLLVQQPPVWHKENADYLNYCLLII